MSEDRKVLFKKFINMRHFFIWPDGIGFRLIIGFIMTLVVSIFLHLRETDMDYLELGTPAKRYVVAQVPFEFPDDEAHSVKKQQSVKNIGTIFEIERDDIDRLRLQLEKEILLSENLNSETNDKIFQAADLLVKALLDARFADTKTLQAIKNAGLFTLNYEIFVPKSSSEKLPKDVFYSIQKRAFSQARIERDVYEMVMKYFDNQTWQFKEDIQAQNALRKTIVTTVPKPMTPVSTGQKIIAQGEMVTSRHVAQVQSMKAAVQENRKLFQPLTFLGSFILALVFVFITWIYLKIKQPHFLQSSKKLALFSCIVIIALIISKVIERLLVGHTSHLIDIVQYPLFVPFATILIAVLINTELALFATAILAVILTTTLAVDETRFLTINLVASLVCLYSARHLKKRTEIFKIVFKGWIACVIVVFSFYFIDDIFFSKSLVQDLISTLIFMFFTAILCIGLLPPLESSFQMMTSITLMEYLDTNHPLLRRFSIEAPGTYQHSLLLSNLAGECAREINANSIFCRAATMYHDIGKIYNPQYFTENQQKGFDMHRLFEPEESAQLIIEHVTRGEALARQYKLPQSFINIIREHHGTTHVEFFYRQALKNAHDDVSKVDETKFRYPGPKPRTKEAAIIMIADSAEAGMHSLKPDKQSEEGVIEHVSTVIRKKTEDEQFTHCPLTFEELNQIKRTLIKLLTPRIRVPITPKSEEKHNSEEQIE